MNTDLVIESRSADETRRIGRTLAARLTAGDVVGLVGELGSGKTVLTAGLVEGAGAGAFVASPTFVLQRRYPGPTLVRHFDLYRLEEPVDLETIGFFDDLDASITVVEWADRAPLTDCLRIRLEIAGPSHRRLTISAPNESQRLRVADLQ
jgi:tRNA threonylcarbamoyl adenosine modification protein YjeE